MLGYSFYEQLCINQNTRQRIVNLMGDNGCKFPNRRHLFHTHHSIVRQFQFGGLLFDFAFQVPIPFVYLFVRLLQFARHPVERCCEFAQFVRRGMIESIAEFTPRDDFGACNEPPNGLFHHHPYEQSGHKRQQNS